MMIKNMKKIALGKYLIPLLLSVVLATSYSLLLKGALVDGQEHGSKRSVIDYITKRSQLFDIGRDWVLFYPILAIDAQDAKIIKNMAFCLGVAAAQSILWKSFRKAAFLEHLVFTLPQIFLLLLIIGNSKLRYDGAQSIALSNKTEAKNNKKKDLFSFKTEQVVLLTLILMLRFVSLQVQEDYEESHNLDNKTTSWVSPDTLLVHIADFMEMFLMLKLFLKKNFNIPKIEVSFKIDKLNHPFSEQDLEVLEVASNNDYEDMVAEMVKDLDDSNEQACQEGGDQEESGKELLAKEKEQQEGVVAVA